MSRGDRRSGVETVATVVFVASIFALVLGTGVIASAATAGSAGDSIQYGSDFENVFSVEDTDAEITDVEAVDGIYAPGDAVPIEVTVQNTGDTSHDFYVDASVRDPNGDWITGEGTTVHLDDGWFSGEERTVTLSVQIPEDATEGTYTAGAGVFYSERKDHWYDSGVDQDALEVREIIDARTTDVTVAGDSYSPGEVASIEVTVENVGNVENEFLIDGIARGPDGTWSHYAGETTAELAPGETTTETFSLEITDSMPDGSYDAGGNVFASPAADNRLDGDHENGAFLVEEDVEEYTLSVESDGNGGIGIDPPGMSTLGTTQTYEEGTEVELIAFPDTDYEFDRWEGDVSSHDATAETITVTMDRDRAITATFQEESSTPPESWTDSPGNSITIREGELVTFSVGAEDSDGSLHGTEWYVDGSFQEATYGLDGNADTDTWSYRFEEPGTYSIEADVFDSSGTYNDDAAEWTVTVEEDVEEYTLSISSENGGGIGVDPPGMSTLGTTQTYEEGTEVELIAFPNTDYEFDRWEGDVSSHDATAETITVTMDRDRAITATFQEEAGGPPESWTGSPEQSPTTREGDLVTFSVGAEDPDGSLHGTEWYVDGSFQEVTYGLDGTTDTDTWSYRFEEPGTYSIEADVFDSSGTYNDDAAEWTVTVEEDVAEYTLSVESDGNGGIGIDPPGMSTLETTQTYEEGTEVELIAFPDTDSEFDRWEGDVSSHDATAETITVTMDRDRTITATFREPAEVDAKVTDVTVAGDSYAPGEVASIEVTVENVGNVENEFLVDGIARGPDGTWSHYAGETTVELAPGETTTETFSLEITDSMPDGSYDAGGNVFASSAADNRLDGDHENGAFLVEEAVEHSFTVETQGSGAVAIDPPGTSTLGTIQSYEGGTEVELTAQSDHGYEFDRWEGDVSDVDTEEPSIAVVADRDRNLTAVFVEETEVDAEIIRLETEDGPFSAGDAVETTAEISNTGDDEKTFVLHYTVLGPDIEASGSGSRANEDITVEETVTLRPGATQLVSLPWTVESDARPGEYGVELAVRNETASGSETPLAEEYDSSAFEVDPTDVGADKLVVSGIERLDPFYEVGEDAVELAVTNPTDREVVTSLSGVVERDGQIVGEPDGSEHVIPAGETKTITLRWDDLPESAVDKRVRAGVTIGSERTEWLGHTVFAEEFTDVTITISHWETGEPLDDVTVHGTVRGDGLLLSNEVEITRDKTGTGEFTFRDVPTAVTLSVSVDKDGFEGQGRLIDPLQQRPLMSHTDFHLRETVRETIQLTDAETGEPLNRVEVTVRETGETATTDATGYVDLFDQPIRTQRTLEVERYMAEPIIITGDSSGRELSLRPLPDPEEAGLRDYEAHEAFEEFERIPEGGTRTQRIENVLDQLARDGHTGTTQIYLREETGLVAVTANVEKWERTRSDESYTVHDSGEETTSSLDVNQEPFYRFGARTAMSMPSKQLPELTQIGISEGTMEGVDPYDNADFYFDEIGVSYVDRDSLEYRTGHFIGYAFTEHYGQFRRGKATDDRVLMAYGGGWIALDLASKPAQAVGKSVGSVSRSLTRGALRQSLSQKWAETLVRVGRTDAMSAQLRGADRYALGDTLSQTRLLSGRELSTNQRYDIVLDYYRHNSQGQNPARTLVDNGHFTRAEVVRLAENGADLRSARNLVDQGASPAAIRAVSDEGIDPHHLEVLVEDGFIRADQIDELEVGIRLADREPFTTTGGDTIDAGALFENAAVMRNTQGMRASDGAEGTFDEIWRAATRHDVDDIENLKGTAAELHLAAKLGPDNVDEIGRVVREPGSNTIRGEIDLVTSDGRLIEVKATESSTTPAGAVEQMELYTEYARETPGLSPNRLEFRIRQADESNVGEVQRIKAALTEEFGDSVRVRVAYETNGRIPFRLEPSTNLGPSTDPQQSAGQGTDRPHVRQR